MVVETQPETDEMTLRADVPTPNGGAYSVAYFQDADGENVPRSRAVRVEIVEFAEDGAEIHRTYGTWEFGARDGTRRAGSL